MNVYIEGVFAAWVFWIKRNGMTMLSEERFQDLWLT
jgi:hypothetical protein